MRKFFTSLLFILFLAPSLFAQGEFPVIDRALEDELYELAEEKVWLALSLPQEPETEAQITLRLVRALLGQERFTDALMLIEESGQLPAQDVFTYWKAFTLFQKGEYREAVKILEKLDDTPQAIRLKASALRADGRLKDAEKTLDNLLERFPQNPAAPYIFFDLAEIRMERGKRARAAATFRIMAETYPDHPLVPRAQFELARDLTGSKKTSSEARELLTMVSGDEHASPDIRIKAWMMLAELEERTLHPAAAAEAMLQAEKLTGSVRLQVLQKAARGTLLARQGLAEETKALFKEALADAPDTGLAAAIQLQKAEALLQLALYPNAEQAFNAYLDVANDTGGIVRAWRGKGSAFWQMERFEESAAAFEKAVTLCTKAGHCIELLFKAGDARLRGKQFEKAFKNYRRIVQEFPDSELAAQALFQCGITRLTAGDLGTAREHFTKTIEQYPENEFAVRSELQMADLLKRETRWEEALAAYEAISATRTNAFAQAASLHQQGLLLYRLSRWADALEKFETVSTTWPDGEEGRQAFYMRGFCRYLEGDREKGVEICRTFTKQHPDSVWTPDVLFWLGEHYYNRGDYAEAQNMFTDVADRFADHESADEALLWAGHAALRQDSFLQAFDLYSRLARTCPQSELLTEARFAQGEALSELGEFPRAVLAYEEVIKTAPDSPLAAQARGRLGDCLFMLGGSDTTRYTEALRAYETLFKLPAIPGALKLQALYKMGRTEQKLGETDKAFARFMETVYAGLETQPLAPDAALWFTRAALDAAAIQENRQHWREAVNIYRRLIEAAVPAAGEAQKRIEKIDREQTGL